MRSLSSPTAFIIISLFTIGCSSRPELAADYLGQTPPTDVPMRFAPDIVSTDHHEHSRIVFSPDGLEMYWAVIPVDPAPGPEASSPFLSDQQNIWSTRKSPAGWSKARILPALEGGRASSPAISASGNTLYFKSPDPQADPDERPRPSLLYGATREHSEWETPAVVSDILPNRKGMVSASFCFADNGNLYFDLGGPDETGAWQWKMYVSEFRGGKYEEPQLLPNGINDGEIDWCPWIAPDESYIVWSSQREGDLGNGDLYVSFHQPGGSWSEPTNLGDKINTPSQERFPSVSPDGQFLFFARHVDNETYNDIYWVDAGIIRTNQDLLQ
jgi:WD40-like Beta Propeller Repeat